MNGSGRRAATALLTAALLLGCEERVIYYHPALGGLPGAESATPINDKPKGYIDPTVVPGDRITITEKDGSKTLVAKTGRHLMVHIYNTLAENDEATFVNQVLSELTKRECFERGVNPSETFKYLKAYEPDIHMLFDQMPNGEMTPGLFLRPMGQGVQRLELDARSAEGLRFIGMDMVMEKGNYRLRWFVSNGNRAAGLTATGSSAP